MNRLTKIVNGEVIYLTDEEEIAVKAEWSKNELENEKNEYKIKRQSHYPSIGDQLDMLWHSMDSGEIPKSLAFYNAIKTVKDKYPKPTK